MELGIASVAAITAVTYLIGMAVGIAPGWAATGVHQSVKQLTKQKAAPTRRGVRASACCCMCGCVL